MNNSYNNTEKEAENFYRSFIQSTDLQVTLAKYRKFAEKAIREPLQYEHLADKLRYNPEAKGRWQGWKQFASDTFLRIVDIYNAANNSSDRSLRKVKDPLVAAILDILGDNARKIHGRPQYETDRKIRFAVLDLVLDLSFSLCQSLYERIRYSALLWNVIRKVSESRKEYDDFYGQAAEDEIIAHTLDLLELTAPNPEMGNRAVLESVFRDNTGNQQLQEFVSALLHHEMETRKEQAAPERCEKSWGERKRGGHPQNLILPAVIAAVVLLFVYAVLSKHFQDREAALQHQKNIVEIMQEEQQELEEENQSLIKENQRLEEENQSLTEENQSLEEEADALRDELAQIQEQGTADAETEYYSYDSDI